MISMLKNFSTGSKDCRKFEENNKTIAFNVNFLPSNNGGIEKMRQTYISDYNLERENQVILLIKRHL